MVAKRGDESVKGDKEFVEELERLYRAYHIEVTEAMKKGFLKENTANTYMLHTGNFIKWCKNDFEPGGRNK